MENSVKTKERFVSVPGIIDIRWKSDDPEIYVEPTDLFQEQEKGLPDSYGKKDRQTTLQAFFQCHLCQCDLFSVVTLRAHCSGSNHLSEELKEKLKYNKKKKAEKFNVREESRRDGVRSRDRSRSPLRVSLEDVENNKKRKKDSNDNKETEETNANVKFREEGTRVRRRSPVRVSLEEEVVRRFHEKVGQAVKTVMNQYWPGAEGFTGVRKISTEEEYYNTARNLSNEIREKIKAGYMAFNRNTLEGLSFTGDHALFIQTEVESFFEERPQIS